jgi:endonuclease/exonuclease/phosphatase family metal-dependent hydrolase
MDIALAFALRVMTINCAHGARAPVPPLFVGRAAIARNLDAIGAAIDGVQPDVVALQEIDRGAFWSGRLDEVGAVASGARMPHVAFGAHKDVPRLGLHHGTAVLSRAPLHAPESTAFRTSFVDDKGWVKVTVTPEALGGRAVDVVSVHLDPFTPWARRRQIAMMQRALGPAHRERPLVVMGDMNAAWGRDGRGDVARLASALGLHAWEPAASAKRQGTYPARRPWRRIDWILLSPELAFASYATVPADVSDHRGVVADVVLAGSRDTLAESWSASASR